MSVRFVELFGLVEVQGPPQIGVRRFGVPVGGWFDRESAQVANTLAKVDKDAACLEATLARVRLVTTHRLEFALAGAPCEVRIDGVFKGATGIFHARPGSEVLIAAPKRGARVYMSARFEALPLPGSRVRSGDELQVSLADHSSGPVKLVEQRGHAFQMVRVVAGPQSQLFDFEGFLSATFTVSTKTNRVGIRLAEKPFPHQIELPSEPAGFGAIQITPDGTPIILGPDGPTIGGYPKIAHVITADQDLLAHLTPTQTIRFEEVSVDEARALAVLNSDRLTRRLTELSLALRLR